MNIVLKVFLKDTLLVTSSEWEPGLYRVGRSEACHVVLCDESISRGHLEFRVTETSVYVTNLGAAGTVRLGEGPCETAEVRIGDSIWVGPYRLVVATAEPSFVEPPVEEELPTKTPVSTQTEIEIKPTLAKLLFKEGPRAGEEVSVNAFEILLGRSKKSDLCLDDGKLSRFHAKILRVGTGFRLVDLDSRNGTFVNGLRVLEHPLSSFDEIQIGPHKLQFLIQDGAMEEWETTVVAEPRDEEELFEQTRSITVVLPEPEPRMERFAPHAGGTIIAIALVVLMARPLFHSKRPAAAPVVAATRAMEAPKAREKALEQRLHDRELEIAALKARIEETAKLVSEPPADESSPTKKPARDPQLEKRKLVASLFSKAVTALQDKSYQLAIETAEKIRSIRLDGETRYLNEAKQIIDRARTLQKEEFEPFLIQASERFAEGNYNASRDLCEVMLKQDAAYAEAKACLAKAKEELETLAQDAYHRGYVLESLNRIEEAVQYWQRARNYVRPGDEYYNKVMRKLRKYRRLKSGEYALVR